jgi:hypothetical protein
MRIKPITINSHLVKFPIKPGVFRSWSGMSGQGCSEYPDIYPESPGNCFHSVNYSESRVFEPQYSEYPDIYLEYPGTLSPTASFL